MIWPFGSKANAFRRGSNDFAADPHIGASDGERRGPRFTFSGARTLGRRWLLSLRAVPLFWSRPWPAFSSNHSTFLSCSSRQSPKQCRWCET